jgi:lipid-A-disaccharide synthase
MIRIGIVAGEASGDRLAAGLIAALRARCGALEVEGVAGPAMIAEGCRALYPSERLAVMGIPEVVRRYAELSRMRRALIGHFTAHPPDCFIGVDAPEFNLRLLARLRARGIRTVQYVSPQVWAWREGRVRLIARAIDLMLVLFPFEEVYYQNHRVPVRYVGHPWPMNRPRRSTRPACARPWDCLETARSSRSCRAAAATNGVTT